MIISTLPTVKHASEVAELATDSSQIFIHSSVPTASTRRARSGALRNESVKCATVPSPSTRHVQPSRFLSVVTPDT